MLTVKNAKEEIVYFINDNLEIEETNFFDWVMRFEDENRFFVRYREDIELNEETGNFEDNGKYWIEFRKVNQRAILLDENFETEEEAEDFCFNRVYTYDFEKAIENTNYHNSHEEAQHDIFEIMAYKFDISKEVAAHIYRKTTIVSHLRKEQDAAHRVMIIKPTKN